MKKKINYSGFLLVLIFLSNNGFTIFAEDESDIDTLIKKEFPTIIIEEKKNVDKSLLEYTSSTIITKKELNYINPIGLNNVLEYQPGIYIKDYGGLGGLKTISLRGTNSMQTLITLDGVRLNSSQTSMFDLSKIPVTLIEQVQISRGGSSAFSGSNSLAGTIELQSLQNIEQDQFILNLSYASFNTINASATISGSRFFHFVSHLDYQHSDGNFPFYSNQFGEVKKLYRQNGAFDRFSFYFFHPFNQTNLLFRPFALITLSRRGSPGAVLQGHIESLDANLDEAFVLLNIPVELSISKTSNFKSNLSLKFENSVYQNPELSFYAMENRIKFETREIQFTTNYTNNLLYSLNYYLGIDLLASEINGNMLDKEVGNNVERYNFAFFSNLDHQTISEEFFNLSTNLGFRIDAVTKLSPNFTYSFGTIANINNSDFVIKAYFSNNFRIPGFNEMYYLNYGNSKLKPEKSYSLNLGLNYQIFENLNIELNGFTIQTYDQIISVPISPLRWSAKNIAETVSCGFEFSTNLYLFEELINFKFNYTYQLITDETPNAYTNGKILVYTPQELINSTILIKTDLTNAVLQFFYSSHRFYLPDNTYNAYLPSYFLMNISFFKDIILFNHSFRYRIDFENLFDRHYEIIKNYPMPGFSLKLSLGLKINFGKK